MHTASGGKRCRASQQGNGNKSSASLLCHSLLHIQEVKQTTHNQTNRAQTKRKRKTESNLPSIGSVVNDIGFNHHCCKARGLKEREKESNGCDEYQ